MKPFGQLVATALLLACLAQPAHVFGLTIGQTDNFESGTTENWVINLLGSGAPPPAALPANIPSGGPGGADDNYLQLTAVGGGGAGSRLLAINVGQWAGNYSGTGVKAIGMDLRNLGATDLSIRLYLENPLAAPPTDTAVTTAALLPAGGDWTHVEFAVDPLALTALTGDVNALLANVTALRIFHSSAATFPGLPIVASLGVDNITALAPATVPEPSALGLLSLGLGGLLAWGPRRRKPAD
jgi:hypothetical protein